MAAGLKDNAYFHADRHVSTKDEDEFDRYPFAAKLARLIAKHYSSHGLVIGIYGQWGEGKSSFMDFVQAATDKLATEEPHYKTIIVKFNPWRFSDEEQLLLSFFAELRAALDTAVDIDTSTLATDLLKYTQILLTRKSVFGETTDEQASKYLALGSLEAVRRDINRAIELTGRKLLILIDDSDRLSNEEVSTTLRLVKLTADFTNTTYLLGINQEMVASAIGRHYAGGDPKAGREFLEKIIQVPLYLPPIQAPKMRRYLQRQLDEVLYRTGHSNQQDEQDKVRYTKALEHSILPAIPNPRSVYRLANTLLVAIPLLEGEANVTDIILIESLRIFYPEVYEIVKVNEDTLTGSPDTSAPDYDEEGGYMGTDSYVNAGDRETIEKIFGKSAQNIGDAIQLLAALFPKVNYLYSSYSSKIDALRKRPQQELHRTKSIASAYYFNRYFYYAVLEGEIPEQTFATFLKVMHAGNLPTAFEQASIMLKLSNDEKFFDKLEDRIVRNRQAAQLELPLFENDKFAPEEAERYCDLLIALSKQLSFNVLGDRAVRLVSRSSGLLLSYIKLLPEERAIAITKKVMTDSEEVSLPLELILDIRRIRVLQSAEKNEFKEIGDLFTENRYREIAQIFIDHCVKAVAAEAGKPWYEVFQHTSRVLLDVWHTAYGKQDIMESLEASFKTNLERLTTFYRYVYPTANSGSHIKAIRLDSSGYRYLRDVMDVAWLYQRSKELVKDEESIPYNDDVFQLPTEHERVHQFIFFHENYDREIEREMDELGYH